MHIMDTSLHVVIPAFILVTVTVLSGCGRKKISEDKATEEIEKRLHQKYVTEFHVEQAERVRYAGNGMPSYFRYETTFTDADGEEYQADINDYLQLYGENLVNDNYALKWFSQAVMEKEKPAEAVLTDVYVENKTPYSPTVKEVYTDPEQYADYIKNHGAYLKLDLTTDCSPAEEKIAHEIYLFASELEKSNVPYHIYYLDPEGRELFFYWNGADEKGRWPEDRIYAHIDTDSDIE